MSEEEIISSLIDKSRMHPTELGKQLLTDLAIIYLAQAQVYLSDNIASEDAAESSTTSTYMQREHPCPRLITPLQPESIMVPQSRCFGIPGDLVGTVLTDEVLQTEAATFLMDPINVTLSEGWKFVKEEGGKARPGWVATVPGSVLKLAFDEDYSEATRLSIGVTYLVSYEHMGYVNITCHGSCHCDSSIISAHDARFKQSVPKTQNIRIWKPKTSSPASLQNASILNGGVKAGNDGDGDDGAFMSCFARFEVLNMTESGEHKFKLIRLSINYFVNVSSELEKHCL